MPHAPAAHVAAALVAPAHTVPHAPQLLVAVRRLVSQPLSATPSQLPYPSTQVRTHALLTHAVVAFAPAMQTVPHVPQFEALVCVLVSHPLAALPSQSAKPAEHDDPQRAEVHVRVALSTAGQAVPHAPQLSASACVSTQLEPQRT